MTKGTYPLNALRAFEAAARQLSYVKAAEELFVTPAAISHQVKRLEEHLGVPLFRRLPRGLLLTATGQLLLSELREIFQRLDQVMERVVDSDAKGPLSISVAPMFAVKWLFPRLQRFAELNPNIDVWISSSLGLIDFQRDAFDAAIRLGHGQYPGLEAIKLFDESVTPMCSPRLLEGTRPVDGPDDLRRFVLLHDDSMEFDAAAPRWENWLNAAGAALVDSSRGPHFGQPDHALQAAVDGVGVALGWRYLAADDIAAGRLVTLFDLVLPIGSAFYLVYPVSYASRPKVVKFRDWLLQEIGSLPRS